MKNSKKTNAESEFLDEYIRKENVYPSTDVRITEFPTSCDNIHVI